MSSRAQWLHLLQSISARAKPFVSLGDKVKKGDVVCLIEVMKLINSPDHRSRRSGRWTACRRCGGCCPWSALIRSNQTERRLRLTLKRYLLPIEEKSLFAFKGLPALGYRIVQVYSEADKDSLAVRLADQAVCIGKAAASASYLNYAAILGAAKLTGADGVHPGMAFIRTR